MKNFMKKISIFLLISGFTAVNAGKYDDFLAKYTCLKADMTDKMDNFLFEHPEFAEKLELLRDPLETAGVFCLDQAKDKGSKAGKFLWKKSKENGKKAALWSLAQAKDKGPKAGKFLWRKSKENGKKAAIWSLAQAKDKGPKVLAWVIAQLKEKGPKAANIAHGRFNRLKHKIKNRFKRNHENDIELVEL